MTSVPPPSAPEHQQAGRLGRAREVAAGAAAYGLMFFFWAVAAGLSANGLIGFGRDNMQLANPWPYLLFFALDGAAGMCAVLLMRRASRSESALGPRLAVWGLVGASAWFNWTHAPARPGAHPAFALMPVIAGVLFEFALHETRRDSGRQDRRMTAVRWLHPVERIRVQMELAAEEHLAAAEATRRVRVGRAAHHLFRLRRLTDNGAPRWRRRAAVRRAQAALHRANFADPETAVEVIRHVQVAVQAERLATLDYSSSAPARELLHALITPAAVQDIVTVLSDADAARLARQTPRRAATQQPAQEVTGQGSPATDATTDEDKAVRPQRNTSVAEAVPSSPARASGTATNNEARAARILADEPNITGAELGRRLNLGARTGQRLLRRLQERDTHTTVGTDPATSDNGRHPAQPATLHATTPDSLAEPRHDAQAALSQSDTPQRQLIGAAH